ncbi:MAG: leucine-rich repeat protein [Cetobacterium sp.]
MALIKPNLIKPNIGGDVDVWGGKLNQNVDAQDLYNKQLADENSGITQEINRLEEVKLSKTESSEFISSIINNLVDTTVKDNIDEYVDEVGKGSLDEHVAKNKIDIDKFVNIKKDELSSYEKQKENELDDYSLEKQVAIDVYVDSKKIELDLHEKQKEIELGDFSIEMKDVISKKTDDEIERLLGSGMDYVLNEIEFDSDNSITLGSFVDKLYAEKQEKTDSSLLTKSKQVVGAINGLNDDKIDGVSVVGTSLQFKANGNTIVSVDIPSGGADIGDGYDQAYSGAKGLILENTKFDDVILEGDKLSFIANGEIKKIVIVQQGGGTGGGSTLMKLTKNNNPSIASVGSSVKLYYEFSSIDPTSGEQTGNGSAVYNVNNKIVQRNNIPQDYSVEFDATNHLVIGSNSIKISVTDVYGTNRVLEYSIDVISVELQSKFDSNEVQYGDISYYLTPIGRIEKTIFVSIDDGEPIVVQNNTSGTEIQVKLPKQSHGNHFIKSYFTAEVEGEQLTSNLIEVEILCVEENNSDVIYKIGASTLEPSQYTSFDVNFLIYDPSNPTTMVEIYSDDVLISSQVADRKNKTFTYKFSEFGSKVIVFEFSEKSYSLYFYVKELEIDIAPSTDGLELYLAASGMSNNSTNKDKWVYKDIVATLANFNFKTNGWLKDEEGNTCLIMNAEAEVNIPIQPFSKDFKSNGKTIEFEFYCSDVEDYESVVMTCMYGGKGVELTPQTAKLKSELSNIATQYKENERVKVAFVVQKTREDRLIILYVNGVLTGVTQYPINDSFLQSSPSNISIKANKCSIRMYNIRVYDTNLTEYQILTNYMYDMENVDRKIELYNKNNIYNAVKEIEYNKVIDHIPCMTIIGRTPAFKGDKVKNDIVYENRQDPSKSFTAASVGNDVQGTSSQYYPRKNYKLKIDKNKGLTMTESMEKLMKYSLRDGDIPIRTICLKADFAESSSTHNTGIAKIMNDTLIEMNILTPPQLAQQSNGLPINYRTCVDGFPIVVFHQETPTSERKFLGKYNFNADKGNNDYYGFLEDVYPNCECIELLNNNSDRVVFRRSDFDEMGEKEGVPYAKWFDDFEFRYPDNDDMNAAFEDGSLKPVRFKRLTDWLATTTDNPTKFKAEYKEYFHEEFLLFYYCITELFAMVDQRAKNLFLTTWDGEKWYSIFYDNDTVFGVDNNGTIRFGFNVEYQDKQDGLSVWNDKTLSNIWANVEKAFAPEIKAMYKRIRETVGYKYVIKYMNEQQSDKWSESIYNEDAKFKYVLPLTEGFYDGYTQSFKYTGEYLPRAQGSREEHRKWWLSNRFHYMDSKYNEGEYIGDYITMRVNVPILIQNPVTPEDFETNKIITDTLRAVPSDTGFDITSFVDQYARVKYEHTEVSSRAYKNTPVRLESPSNFVFSDTNTILYGASRLNDLGDLAPKYPSYLSLASAINVTKLIIGSNKIGYNNRNLKTLVLGNNRLLKHLDVRNCSGLSSSLDLQGCTNISEIYATGTSLTSIGIPAGGVLSKIHYPNTIVNITIKENNKLEEVVLDGTQNVSTLILENNDRMKSGDLLSNAILDSRELSKVRVLGIKNDGYFTEDMLVDVLDRCIGIDDDGFEIPTPIITGEITAFTSDLNSSKKHIDDKFPSLKINWLLLDGYTFERVMIDEIDGYAISANNNLAIDEKGEIVIPRKYNGLDIIEIRDFKNLQKLTRINGINSSKMIKITKDSMLGNGVLSLDIGQNLRYLNIRGCNQIKYVNGVYSGISVENNNNMKKVDVTGTTINNISFVNCNNLSEIEFERTNKDISINITNCPLYNAYENILMGYSSDSNIKEMTLTGLDNYDLKEELKEKQGWLVNVREHCDKYVLKGALMYELAEAYSFDEQLIRNSYPDIRFSFNRIPITYGYYVNVKDSVSNNVDMEVSYDSGADTACVIRWGDGDSDTVLVKNGDEPKQVSHKYRTNGDFVIKMEKGSGLKKDIKSTSQVEFKDIYVDKFTYGINNNAFRFNSKLKKATIPPHVTESNLGLYTGCELLESFTYTGTRLTSIYANMFDGCKELVNVSMTETITVINSYGFNGCKKLSLTDLPLNITEIGAHAFNGCSNLLLSELPNKIVEIHSNCFNGCTNLRLTHLPNGVRKLNNYSFYRCENISMTILPSGLTTIPWRCFTGCKKLALTELPSGVGDIGENSFDGCEKLALTTLPVGVTEILYRAFTGCSNISINDLTRITKINAEAFRGCSKMTNVKTGVNLLQIDAWGASFISNPTSKIYIYFSSIVPPNINIEALVGNSNNVIYVPSTSINAYKAATNWTRFASQIIGWNPI